MRSDLKRLIEIVSTVTLTLLVNQPFVNFDNGKGNEPIPFVVTIVTFRKK